MQTEAMKAIALDALDDIKGKDVVALDVSKMSALFECMIIASGDSTRQVKALANNVREKLKEAGADVLGIEGEQNGEWVLVDCGTLLIHVMLPPIREYYDIETLWGGQRPVPSALRQAQQARGG